MRKQNMFFMSYAEQTAPTAQFSFAASECCAIHHQKDAGLVSFFLILAAYVVRLCIPQIHLPAIRSHLNTAFSM